MLSPVKCQLPCCGPATEERTRGIWTHVGVELKRDIVFLKFLIITAIIFWLCLQHA